MPVSRRHLLIAAATVTAFGVAERGVRLGSDVAARALAGMRPAADGTSATRCALCGAADHAMLDPRCPRAFRRHPA